MAARNLFRQDSGKVYLRQRMGQFISESNCLPQCTGRQMGAELAPQIRFQDAGQAAGVTATARHPAMTAAGYDTLPGSTVRPAKRRAGNPGERCLMRN
jgi:hypothetical protein